MTVKLELYTLESIESIDEDPVASPSSEPPKSLPPPLPESARKLSPARVAADDAFADGMLERLAAGDYLGVVMAAGALLEHQPNHADALDCLQIARSELISVYVARLGSTKRVPRVAMSAEGLMALSLDFAAGLVLSHVNAVASIDDIVRACGLPKVDALRILSELFLRRGICLSPK
jgi:hypothetical protein